MRRRKLNSYGYFDSTLSRLRRRSWDNGTEAVGGGTATLTPPASQDQDVPPVNGGPDRDYDSLASGTIDEPSGSTPPTGPAPTPADPNQRAGHSAAQQQAADGQWQSIREAAEAQGFRFDPTVTDDRTALNFLLRQAAQSRQSDVYAQLGRQLAPRAGEIQQYLQRQASPAAPAERQPWEAPEFDERWVNLVEQDPASGMYVSKQGVPHEIAQKVNAYAEWKRGYDRNPAAVINGMVEARARAVAEETFRSQFESQQREATIASIVEENSSWMYQVDQSGQRLRDYNGQYIPTPVGAAYVQQLQNVRNMGVASPRDQDALAKQLVRGMYAQAYQSQQAAGQQQAANPQTQQAVARPNVNPAQSLPPSQRRLNPAATDPDDAGLSLAERIRRDLAAEGVSDQDIYRAGE